MLIWPSVKALLMCALLLLVSPLCDCFFSSCGRGGCSHRPTKRPREHRIPKPLGFQPFVRYRKGT